MICKKKYSLRIEGNHIEILGKLFKIYKNIIENCIDISLKCKKT